MKLKKMKWLGAILLGLTFFITSCDKDQENVTSIDQEKVYKKEITFNDFEQILLDNNIRDAVSKQLTDQDTFTIQSTKNRDNLVIRIKKGKVTQLNSIDNLTTYSMYVDVLDNDSRKHYYKLILITQSGKSTYKLLKFIPENNVTSTTGQFKGVVENIELNENSTITSKECVDTYFVYEIFMPCSNPNHPGQYEPNASINCDGGHWETRVGTIRCSGGGGGTGGSTSGSGNSWTGGGSTGTPINYLGNYPIDEDPYPVPTPEEVFTNFKVGLSQEAYNFLLKTPGLESQIKEYLFANLDYQNNFTAEAEEFVKGVINFFIIENQYSETGKSEQANLALSITLNLLNTNNFSKFGKPEVDTLIQNQLIKIDPGYGVFGFMAKYNTLVMQEVAVIMSSEYPIGYKFKACEVFQIVLQAQSEALHLGLDILGMSPVVGPVFDVTHGVWYTFSGNFTDASLSFAAVVPFAGDWTTVARITKRVYNIGSTSNKVILKAYKLADGTIKFSNRSQLRKVLGLIDITKHAHHVIPYGLGSHRLVQLAAKFSSNTKKAWHINDINNGIALPADFHLNGHSAYTDVIVNKMNQLYIDAGGNMELAYDLLTNFTHQVKTIIANNPNKTLGEIALLIK